jgi:biopolymer transport protein ExbB
MQEVGHALMEGAPFSFINVAVLAFVLAIIAERFVYILTRYRVNSREFMAQIRKLVQAGNIDRAIKLCEAAPFPPAPGGEVGSHAGEPGRGRGHLVHGREVAELLPELEKRISSLWTLANIATLIGLLGTISRPDPRLRRPSVRHRLTAERSRRRMLSAGISEAMWNTASSVWASPCSAMIFHLIIHSMGQAPSRKTWSSPA